MPKVVHCKRSQGAYYVGRKRFGNHFGNPFSHKPDSMADIIVESREEAVARFSSWLNGISDHDLKQDRRKWILEHLYLLKDKNLSCWCAPELCHAEILIKLANSPQ
jgi:hypothetical protein